MEHAHLEELVGSNQYVADEGYVITNYKEGDEQIIYSSGLIFAKGYEPEGFYTMLEADASTLADKINPKPIDHAAEEAERRAQMQEGTETDLEVK